MFVGHIELIIVGIIGVLLFGSRLPKIARSVGSAIPSFKRGLREVEKELDDINSKLE